MSVVFDLADRISVLVYGEVIATDTPARIRDNAAVQTAYLGSAPRCSRSTTLHAYYGKSHILQGVTLHVGEGEIVSLLGRNGAGRSTAIRDDHGPRARRSGRISFQGRAHRRPRSRTRSRGAGLGYVPEDRAIFPTLTVRENLLLGMKARRSRRAGGRQDDVLALFPMLRERIDAPGGVLSGGEQQMLTICRTLMGDPGAHHGRRADRRACAAGDGARARAARADRRARCRDPADRAEADDRPRDLASAVRDGAGPHRVRGHARRSCATIDAVRKEWLEDLRPEKRFMSARYESARARGRDHARQSARQRPRPRHAQRRGRRRRPRERRRGVAMRSSSPARGKAFSGGADIREFNTPKATRRADAAHGDPHARGERQAGRRRDRRRLHGRRARARAGLPLSACAHAARRSRCRR